MSTMKEALVRNDDSNKMGIMSRYPRERARRDARHIYLSEFSGECATIMHDDSPHAGYPLGSVMPFCLDHQGNIIIYTADIAQHTLNIKANGKASILVRDVSRNHQPNTSWRLLSMCDAGPVKESEYQRISERYFRHHPKALKYENAHDFYFYQLRPIACRLIMGFGKIAWLDPKEFITPSPFSEADEHAIITHMNADHSDALSIYLNNQNINVNAQFKSPQLVGLNQYGITISYTQHLHFIRFKEEVSTPKQVREQLVAMAKLS